jgi:hypothetical protein
VTLLITLVLITLVLFALFLGGGLVAQGYLYQEPADRLPLRALAGSVLVGLFIMMWVLIDRGAPRKYDTFFQFSPYTTREFTEFEAVRWVSPDGSRLKKDEAGNRVEIVVKFKRGTGSRADKFLEETSGEQFLLSSSNKSGESYMTVALRPKLDPDAEPVRFSAPVKDRGETATYSAPRESLRFIEDGGSRYIQADQLGVVYVPSTWGVVLALFINFVHVLVWFVVFWPILQFTRGHAFVLAIVFSLVTMLALMPLLFERNRPRPGAATPQTALAAPLLQKPHEIGEKAALRAG